jgi:type II secretory pathway pseudopilin PulG
LKQQFPKEELIFNKMSYKSRKKEKGFTLVETLVAIGILSLSILSGFTAVQGSLKNSSLSKDQITAFFLTQEAFELIKNIRDTNALVDLGGTPTNWLAGMAENSGNPCYFGNVCRIDYLKTLTNCNGAFGACPFLNQSISGTSLGLFGYTAGWQTTKFKREIQFESVSADQVYVTVRITWLQGGINQTFEVKQLLFRHG